LTLLLPFGTLCAQPGCNNLFRQQAFLSRACYNNGIADCFVCGGVPFETFNLSGSCASSVPGRPARAGSGPKPDLSPGLRQPARGAGRTAPLSAGLRGHLGNEAEKSGQHRRRDDGHVRYPRQTPAVYHFHAWNAGAATWRPDRTNHLYCQKLWPGSSL